MSPPITPAKLFDVAGLIAVVTGGGTGTRVANETRLG